jgi:hypothetical protein
MMVAADLLGQLVTMNFNTGLQNIFIASHFKRVDSYALFSRDVWTKKRDFSFPLKRQKVLESFAPSLKFIEPGVCFSRP